MALGPNDSSNGAQESLGHGASELCGREQLGGYLLCGDSLVAIPLNLEIAVRKCQYNLKYKAIG